MKVEIRKQGKSKKYYLAHSFRHQGKVKKVRRYLGSNLKKEEIEYLSQRAKVLIEKQIEDFKILRDPLKFELSKEELEFLNSLNIKNVIKIDHLNEDQWKVFTEIFAYNTNAIEGSEVDQKEVKEILEQNKWPQEAKKEDISETYGVAEAIDFIKKTKEPISIELIKKLHMFVFKNSKSFA